MITKLFSKLKNKTTVDKEFYQENSLFLLKINKVVAPIFFVIILLTVLAFEKKYFAEYLDKRLPIRISFLIGIFLLSILPFFSSFKKYAHIQGIAFYLINHLHVSLLAAITPEDNLVLITWIVHTILITSLYPLPILSTSVLLSLGLFAFNIFYFYWHEIINDLYLMAMVDISFAGAMSLGFKYVFMRTRKSEFWARKELREANDKITALNTELLSLDKAKTNFFANVSHELRTPLTLILSPLSSLQQGHYGDSISQNKQLFLGMKKNGEQLLRLVNNLLDFSKIEAGRMAPHWEILDLSEFLLQTMASFESLAKSKGITFTLNLSEFNSLPICTDKSLLEKVIYNLVSNALKFTPEDGKVVLALMGTEKDAIITMEDTGIGIASDQQNQIFERFVQVDASANRKYEGTGIGLALVKEIVTIFQGEIHVQSQIGQGSVFTVTLPRVCDHCPNSLRDQLNELKPSHFLMNENTVKKDSQTKNSQPSKLNQHTYPHFIPEQDEIGHLNRSENATNLENKEAGRILIVEDNPDMRQLLQSILGEEFFIVQAENGMQGLEVMRDNQIDLIISDVMMPHMDGFEMVEKIRSRREFDGTTIVFLSAKADVPDRVRGLEGGAIDFIVKPFVPQEFLSKVRSHMKMISWRKAWKKGDLVFEGDSSLSKESGINSSEIMIKKETHIPEQIREKICIVKNFLSQNFMDDIAREGLAAMVELTPDYLSRMFFQVQGQKIGTFINNLRLENMAKQLLATDIKIVDIAYQSGFESLRNCNRIFKIKYGMSPQEYRNHFKQ